MNLSEPFIRRPIATSLLLSAIAFLGIAAFPFLTVAPLPQIDFPTVLVTATLAGASAETMASSVATPLERQIGQIAGVTQLTSLSALGATSITVQFDLNRNIDLAAQDVQAAITAASKTLPQTMTAPPTYKKLNPADAPILILSASSDTLPITLVDEYADSFLAQQISQVSGVAQVTIGGEQRPAIRVQLDPAKLASRGLTLEEVRGALVSATTNAPKGSLTTPTTSFTIDANDQITDAKPFENVILAYRNGAPVRVRDVGRSVAAAADRFSAAYRDNHPAILLSVYKQPGANVIETVERIKALLPKVAAVIPPAVEIDTVLDRTATIRASVLDVEFTLALTIVLVVVVVLVFLRDTWATLVPGLTIVLSLLGSFAVMYAFDFSLDNISLMALTIAVGFVVDDAIVEVENVYRHIEGGAPLFEAALTGSAEIRFTVLSISLSLIVVFLPLLLMGGIVGRLFREFSVTVIAAVAASAFVSLTLAPMLCSRFLRRPSPEHGRLYRSIEAGFEAMLALYRRTLDLALRHAAITLGVFFATLALTVILAIQIPKGFFPIQDTGMLNGLAEAAQEVSPAEMMRLQRELGAVLLRDPDIAGFASQTGSIGGNGNAQTANTARFFIDLKPRDQRTASATEIINRLRPQIAKIEGANLFLQATQDITVGGRASRATFQYTLQDPDVSELVEWSGKMLEKLKTLPELVDVSSDLLATAPRLKVTINRDQAARFGITPQMVDDTLNDAYGQRQITQYFTQLNTYWIILEVQMDLSVMGMIAIILLIGIVKKNGIMLVDFAITAERDHHMTPYDAIRQACLQRFRPIMMTTAAAMMAGIPLAFGRGTGSELRQPLGYAMVGGLALNQLLTLYTTPVIYLYLDQVQIWLRGLARRDADNVQSAPAAAAQLR